MLSSGTNTNRIGQHTHRKVRGSRKSSTRPVQNPVQTSSNIAEFAVRTLGLRPDPVQLDLLEANPHRLILNCCRQWGKSTVTAAKAIHQAYCYPGSLIIVASSSGRQSSEFVRKASGYVRKLGIQPRGDGENEISLLLPNGSRIVGLPGNDDTTRGFSAVNLLLIDEASRVPDQLYLSLRPMLAVSNGQLWLMSTPRGRSGFFYDTWFSPDPRWTRLAIPATQCPRIAPEFLEEERAVMPARFFAQEYLCEFMEAEDSVFPLDILQALYENIRPLFGESILPERTVFYRRFFIGIDLGQKKDYTAIAIIEKAKVICGPRSMVTYEYPTETVYSIRHLERLPLGTSYPDIVAHIRALTRHPALGDSREVVVDATGVGQPVVDLLKRADLGCRLVPVTLTSGGKANSDGYAWRLPRHELLVSLEIAIQQQQLRLCRDLKHAPTLISELQSLRRKIKDTGADAVHPWRDSQHDDFVFATALAHWRAVESRAF